MAEENNQNNQEETQNVETQEGGFDVKAILENEEFQKYLQSFSDRRVSEAIKTNEKKWKQKLADEKKKLEMTQEEILQEKERELHERELKLEKIQYFKDKKYDLDMADFVTGEDIEEVKEKADLLMKTINKAVEKQVEERLKSGYTPPKGEEDKGKNTDSMGLKLAKMEAENNKSAIDSQNKYFNT